MGVCVHARALQQLMPKLFFCNTADKRSACTLMIKFINLNFMLAYCLVCQKVLRSALSYSMTMLCPFAHSCPVNLTGFNSFMTSIP